MSLKCISSRESIVLVNSLINNYQQETDYMQWQKISELFTISLHKKIMLCNAGENAV